MTTNRINKRHNGIGLVYAIMIMVALCAICSFAVDYGRVELAKTQLRSAADAAALAAANTLLSDITAAPRVAAGIASANLVDGKPVILDTALDVEIGNWDAATHTFTPLIGTARVGAKSCRVTARRTEARGNAIDLPFARLIGKNYCDVTASAVAVAVPPRFAAVGLEYIKMGGNATNSYKNGTSGFGHNGDIASNGDITLGGSSFVDGNAYPGIGRRVIGANHVTGATTPLTYVLNYPPVDASSFASHNDNANVPQTAISSGSIRLVSGKTVTLPGGNYYFRDMYLGGGCELVFNGPATIYLTGNLEMHGHAAVYDNLPRNLRIVMASVGTTALLDMQGGSSLSTDIYAPEARISIMGTGDVYGAIVGKSIDMSGNAAIHYDMSLRGGVSLVK
jgi:hypothetical protein